MPQYRVYKPVKMETLDAEQVAPIKPAPYFESNTAHIRVVQGGFMDDRQIWHSAPKRVKEAVRINGYWYWACRIRDRKGNLIISKSLLFPVLGDF